LYKFTKILKTKKQVKAYSLLEVIISLSIIGVCTIVMLNFTILSFRITSIGLARSLVREELANVMNLIGKDFRRVDLAPTCNSEGTSCDFYVDGLLYRWYLCSNNEKICKDEFIKAANAFTNVYSLSENVKVNYFKFQPGFSSDGSTTNSNVLLTISASHANQSLGVNNVIKQASFSIRNYVL